MSTRFKAIDRETPYLLPPSVQDWLPEQHLARFIVEVVSKMAESAEAEVPEGMDIPAELARREDRL